MVDLAIVTENIEKIRQFQNDNKAEINSAFSNQDAILEEIWTEEQAKIRQEQGLWECVAGVTTVVLGGAAIILSGGAAIPIVLGVATIAFGSSDIIEGTQDVYYGSVGDISSKSFNPLRDTLFFGNQRAYDIAESIVTSKGADWVDNNWDNLVLTTKYTFSNSGKSVTLGSNGANVVNDFRENFNKADYFKVIKESTAEDINKWWKDVMGYDPPYTPGTITKEIKLVNYKKFVRVYDGTNSKMYGGWIMDADDIDGLTALEIQDKYALPFTPKYICDVDIDAGTILRTGEANTLFGYKGVAHNLI